MLPIASQGKNNKVSRSISVGTKLYQYLNSFKRMWHVWHYVTFKGSKMNRQTDGVITGSLLEYRGVWRQKMSLYFQWSLFVHIFGSHEIHAYFWQPVQRRRWRVWNWSCHRGPNGWNCWSMVASGLTADTWSHAQTHTLTHARLSESQWKTRKSSINISCTEANRQILGDWAVNTLYCWL